MKKLFLFLAAASLTLTSMADEGMWLLPYLQKMNAKQLKERGCKLSPEEIYSMNHTSLKDAVVVFGPGCTGEIVSPDGLLFTNHHCGYGSIQALSSVEHDYLKNGFWAMSREEELPAPGLKVRFVRQIMDVTPDLIGNIPSTAGQQEYERMVRENGAALSEKLRGEHPGLEVQIKSFFGGNLYFAFLIEVFTDVRLVAAPPTSIGKFGGETDNWMWPRHTGDFSIFRVYAGPDNKPADYAPENRPYKAEKYLKISLDGYGEGDFGMIMGFPGTTQRYMTSYEIDRLLEVENPQRISIRGERQDILKEDMAASDKVRIQYASKYAVSSNYWKNSIGKSRGIRKLRVKERKQEQEAEFCAWAAAQTLPEERFAEALDLIRDGVNENAPYFASEQYLREAVSRAVEILTPARYAGMLREKKLTPEAFREQLAEFYKDYNLSTDRKVARRMLQLVQQNCKELPDVFKEVIDKEFGGDTGAYVDYLYDNSVFTDEAKALAAVEGGEDLTTDPAAVFGRSVDKKLHELVDAQRAGNTKIREGQRLYIAGLMRMQPEKAWAPDANFTIRLTYGRVLPYDPADGIRYNYYTTLKGVMEKEDKNNPTEFTVPERLKEIYAAGDYGRYANAGGELPVAFLVDCDITGGNSGSPVMNARGELIGLAFDGNWEAMSGDVAFEPQLQRTIAVDIRYVLLVIDKFGGAGWLLDELDIR
ncbi:S46 family peptidase [Alistipes sp.]|uniref:S46 family peptidase n=1 Tax=Alistipes sp. TaxID=1872444 RepID=UPI003AEFC351